MKIMVDDLLINYEDEGKGKTILLLHGWGAQLRTYDELAKHLQTKYRVLRFDFPGFGSSEQPLTDWGVGEYSQFVANFLKKLDVGDVYAVISHSFGGRVMLKGAGSGILSPKKIVLMGSAGVKPAKTLKQAIYRFVAKSGKLLTSLPLLSRLQPMLKKHLYESAGTTDYLYASNMKQIFLNTINEDLKQYASQIQIPSLLIWGEDDTSTPVSDGKTLHSLMNDSQFIVVPKAGHFVYLDDPLAATRSIDGFLS